MVCDALSAPGEPCRCATGASRCSFAAVLALAWHKELGFEADTSSLSRKQNPEPMESQGIEIVFPLESHESDKKGVLINSGDVNHVGAY